ncbi:ornithine cyclodeaminase family protein [Amaricoccus macauensis]|uniref:ornithine cyclodeaminase family protein n=1 Tax=Amaricoccus macauensis TaxID=57001 RepID=UPI003C79C50F
MKILSAEETRAALPWKELIEALEAGFRTDVTSPLRHHHHMANTAGPDDVLLLMPAWLDSGWGGVKLVNVHPGNSERGLPAISSTYLLFDRETGQHRLILDGGELTARRTAAASALGAAKLARKDATRHLVVGAGRVGANIPHAYGAVLDIGITEVWSRRAANAETLVAELRAAGLDARVAHNLEAAVREADIVTCATLAREPVVRGAWLKPGAHLDLIGSFTPDMRETDDAAMQRGRIFIDTDHARTESGELLLPLESGAIAEDDIEATLFDLCRGTKDGRGSDDEITIFKAVGMASEDLSAATLAARMTGII